MQQNSIGNFVGTAQVERTGHGLNINFYNPDVPSITQHSEGECSASKEYSGDFDEKIESDPLGLYFELREKIKNVITPGFYNSAAFATVNIKIDLAAILQDNNFLDYVEGKIIKCINISFWIKANQFFIDNGQTWGNVMACRPDIVKAQFADEFSGSIFGQWGCVFLEYLEKFFFNGYQNDHNIFHWHLVRFEYINLENPINRTKTLCVFWNLILNGLNVLHFGQKALEHKLLSQEESQTNR